MKNHFVAVACPSGIFATGRTPLLVQTEFLRPAERRCLSKRNFRDRQNAVARPNGIPATGRTPLLVQAEFPRTAVCRSLPKQNLS